MEQAHAKAGLLCPGGILATTQNSSSSWAKDMMWTQNGHQIVNSVLSGAYIPVHVQVSTRSHHFWFVNIKLVLYDGVLAPQCSQKKVFKIYAMEWRFCARFLCLIGSPGDLRKSMRFAGGFGTVTRDRQCGGL
mmetsp:Transcript_28752/g.66789  ORF Transcript_28752/g.66789 Transcript_28752/m.66789 type:complete len:133 (+) Transcript_28752:55-453(+)